MISPSAISHVPAMNPSHKSELIRRNGAAASLCVLWLVMNVPLHAAKPFTEVGSPPWENHPFNEPWGISPEGTTWFTAAPLSSTETGGICGVQREVLFPWGASQAKMGGAWPGRHPETLRSSSARRSSPTTPGYPSEPFKWTPGGGIESPTEL